MSAIKLVRQCLVALGLFLSISVAPAKADLYFDGNVRVTLKGVLVYLFVDRIINTGPLDWTTGTIKLEVWAFKKPFVDSQRGYQIAFFTYDPLEGGFNYRDIWGQSRLRVRPKPGKYYLTVFLEEYTEYGYETRDSINLYPPIRFMRRR